MEERFIAAQLPDASEDHLVVRFATEPPWRVEVVGPDGHVYTAEDADLFYALRAVRSDLETAGIRLCCNGARWDVWPSGMSGQMSGGRAAYVIRRGVRPTLDDVVDIFDPTSCDKVATVQQQHENVRRIRGL